MRPSGWKQALIAISLNRFEEIWNHKLLTVRAVVSGWTVLFIYVLLLNPSIDLLDRLASWSRWWRYGKIPVLVMTVVSIVFCVCSGWLVARLHRPHQIAMVLIYAVSVFGVIFTWFSIDVVKLMQQGIFPPHFLISVVGNILDVVGILIGGGVLSADIVSGKAESQ